LLFFSVWLRGVALTISGFATFAIAASGDPVLVLIMPFYKKTVHLA
jgi:hypothetical protein